jgi:hypothetical protein
LAKTPIFRSITSLGSTAVPVVLAVVVVVAAVVVAAVAVAVAVVGIAAAVASGVNVYSYKCT